MPILLHVYPQFRTEDEFLDLDYELVMSMRQVARKVTGIGG